MSIGGFTMAEAALAEQLSEPSMKRRPIGEPSPKPTRPCGRNRVENPGLYHLAEVAFVNPL